jgi:putative copper resistance protein D
MRATALAFCYLIAAFIVSLDCIFVSGGALAHLEDDTVHHPSHEIATGSAERFGGNNAYSLFMHRATGAIVLLIGSLMFVDRLLLGRYPELGIVIGCLWILIGGFLFVRADPEGWPMGESGIFTSFTMPTAGEWLQHKILSLIPMMIGLHTVLVRNSHSLGNCLLAATAFFGAIGLLAHQHRDHVTLDIANSQHRLFAITALLTSLSLLLETSQMFRWRRRNLLFPICVTVLGLQLLLYTE